MSVQSVQQSGESFLSHITWTGCGDAAVKLAMLVTTLSAAWSLSPAAFGRYVGLYAVALFAALLWDFGVSTLVTREAAAGRLEPRGAARQALRLRLRTTILWALALVVGFEILSSSVPISTQTQAAFCAGSAALSLNTLAVAGLRGDLRFREAALSTVAGRWTTAIATLAFLTVVPGLGGLEALGLAFALGECLALIVAGLAWLRDGRAGTGQAGAALTFSVAAPFAANGVLATAYNRMDILLVAALTSAAGAGAYATASRFQDILYIVPATLGAVALPAFSRTWSEKSPERSTRLVGRLTLTGLLIALPLAAGASALAPVLVQATLGARFATAVAPIRIMVWFLPLAVIQAPLLALLSATGRAADTTKVFVASFAVAMLLHLSLDWWAGASGAAIASLGRDIVATPFCLLLAARAGLLRRASGWPLVELKPAQSGATTR